MPITLISGAPGTGKSSLARFLSASDPSGVHIETDFFFRFLAHKVDPSLPDAHRQNATVVRAYVAAATAYAAGGYRVYLDGVFGPWMLPLVMPVAPGIEYVLLHAPYEVTLARAEARTSQPSAKPEVVGRMHEQFAQILEPYRKHVIQTDGRTVEEIADEYRAGNRAGAYILQNF